MASVTLRVNRGGSETWRVQFRIDGRLRQESFATRKAAVDFGRLVDKIGGRLAREVLCGRQRGNDVPTMNEWVSHYLDTDSGILTGIEPGTRAGYRGIASRSFLQILGEYPVDVVQKEDVGRWVSWQEKQYPASAYKDGTLRDGAAPIAAKTVRNYHALLSNVFKAAVEAGYRNDNPAKRTRLRRGTPREAVFLSRDEFAAIYRQVPTYYQPFVAFLVFSQLRWSEATALKWDRVNTDTVPPTIRVSRAWKRNPDNGAPVLGTVKSAKGRRTVSLWPGLVAQLGPRRAPDEFVFHGKQGAERLWYGPFRERIWVPAVRRADIGKTPRIHDLRHTGASWLIADGTPLPFIQARLGHESITTTIGVYGHLLPDAHTQMAVTMQHIAGDLLAIETSHPEND